MSSTMGPEPSGEGGRRPRRAQPQYRTLKVGLSSGLLLRRSYSLVVETFAWPSQLGSQERDLAERLRASLIVALIQGRPLVIHDTDDELEMARWCEAIWPSEKTRRVRAGIEAERAEAGGV
jgi:hypothetical protein